MSVAASTLRAMSVFVILRWIAPVLFFMCVGVVVAVGAVTWRRTAPLRKGRGPPGHRPRLIAETSRTSRATLVPGVAGGAAAAWATASGPPLGRGTLAVGGILVAVSGVIARVTAVEVTPTGLVVRYAARRPFELPWGACRVLRPPRWPLGGWRVMGPAGNRALMPSDLLGSERMLDGIIGGAGLRFAGREWRRPTEADREAVSRTG